MRAANHIDLKLFWLMIALGLACAGIGGGMMWLNHAAANEERSDWVYSEARVYEVGIRWSAARIGVNYEMTARYLLNAGGRDYEGGEIAGGYHSKSADEVRSLIVSFAPEAAEFSLQDLGTLNPQRTWSVAYRPVPARYDPRDPTHSQIVLPNPLANESVGVWVSRVIAWFFLVLAIILWLSAWPAVRRLRARNSRNTVQEKI